MIGLNRSAKRRFYVLSRLQATSRAEESFGRYELGITGAAGFHGSYLSGECGRNCEETNSVAEDARTNHSAFDKAEVRARKETYASAGLRGIAAGMDVYSPAHTN